MLIGLLILISLTFLSSVAAVLWMHRTSTQTSRNTFELLISSSQETIAQQQTGLGQMISSQAAQQKMTADLLEKVLLGIQTAPDQQPTISNEIERAISKSFEEELAELPPGPIRDAMIREKMEEMRDPETGDFDPFANFDPTLTQETWYQNT